MSKILSAGHRLRAGIRSQRFGFQPSDIYGEEFYKQDVDAHQAVSADDVADALVTLFSPSTLFDVGCGNGIYLRAMSQRGVQAFGCDGSMHGVRLCGPDTFAFQHDLKDPLIVNRRLDLCICFEVAEHIPTRYSQNLVRSCCGTSDTVVFSSAPVGQGGTDHINEQPPEFWDAHFRNEGFTKSLGDTETLQANFRQRNVVQWLTNNSRVYRKN